MMLDAKECKIVAGRWEDPYTGRVYINPQCLNIDHFKFSWGYRFLVTGS